MICLIERGHNRHAQSHHLFTWSGERGEPEVTSRADTVIEIDAMNRYIHDGTVADACLALATRSLQQATYDEGYVCGAWGEGGLYASHPLHRSWVV